MTEMRGIGAATVAFRRLLADAGASDQSRIDALVALVRHTVFAVTMGDDERLRTLSNPAGESAAPLFTGHDVMQMAARGFGWSGPDGKLASKELGAREALRQALAQGVQFVVLDLGSAYATEFARREVESVLAAQKTAGVGAYAATGTASEIIRSAVRESTRPPPGPNSVLTPVPQMPPPPRMPVVEMDEPFRRASRISSTPLPRPATEIARSLAPSAERTSPVPAAPRAAPVPAARAPSAPVATPSLAAPSGPSTQPAMPAAPSRSPLPAAPGAAAPDSPFPMAGASGMGIPAVPPNAPLAGAPTAGDFESIAAAPAAAVAAVAAPTASASSPERDPLVRRAAAATLFQVAPPKRPDSMPRVSFSSAPPPMPEADAPQAPVHAPPPPPVPSMPARKDSSGSMPAVRAPSAHNVPAPAPTAAAAPSASTTQTAPAPQATPYMRRRSTATMPKSDTEAASAAKKLAEKVMRAAAAPEAQRFTKSVNPLADKTLQHIAESLRRYPEVEWACELADEQGRPLIGLRLDPAFQNRADEISELVVSSASERKMTVHVTLLTDTAKLREARSLGRIFYPWRKK